jgi:hypothetical protein
MHSMTDSSQFRSPSEVNADGIICRASSTQSLLRRESIKKALVEQEQNKREILEEFGQGQFDIIEKEVERTKFIKDFMVSRYSYLVLLIIFLIYTGNQWQRYSKHTFTRLMRV